MPTEIKIISHSNVFYWWPAWVVGFSVALISFVQGREIAIEPGIVERVHPSNNPGIFFIAVVLGANKETIQIPNVLFVDRKMKAIERLIAVKPDEVRR